MDTEAKSDEGKRATRVLLVEDHGDTAKVLVRLLGRKGYEVEAVSTVREALTIATLKAFDVLVSDIGLPDGSGHDLMVALKARWEMKGIALSGYGLDEDVRLSEEAGFSAFLTKPVEVSRLMEVIEEVIARR